MKFGCVFLAHPVEQAKITYSPLGKTFKKQIKTIESQGQKQIKALTKHKKQLIASNKNKRYDYDDVNQELLNKKKNLMIFLKKGRIKY